jgi:hypothetical protein
VAVGADSGREVDVAGVGDPVGRQDLDPDESVEVAVAGSIDDALSELRFDPIMSEGVNLVRRF